MRSAAVVATVLLACLALPVTAQEPASIQDVGWWTQTPGAQPKDQGGFEVARGPTGDLSVAALRVLVSQPLRRATLVVIESGGVGQDAASIIVCATSAAWSPSNPGAWEERPPHGCDRGSAELTRTQTGWAADVLSLITGAGQQPSLVVLPDPDASNPIGFQIDFAVATLDAEVEPAAPAPTPAPPFAPPLPAVPSTTVPDRFAQPQPVAGPAPEPAEPITAAPIQEPDTFVTGRDFVPPADDPGPSWWRLAFLIPLAAAAGAVTAYARRLLRDRGMVEATG